MLEVVIVGLALMETRIPALVEQAEVGEGLHETFGRVFLVEILVEVPDRLGNLCGVGGVDAVGDVVLVATVTHRRAWCPKKACTIEI